MEPTPSSDSDPRRVAPASDGRVPGGPRAARELIGEPIAPDPGSFQSAPAARGEPAWPLRFSWRGRDFVIAKVLRSWKTTDAAHSLPGSAYVRRHWLDVVSAEGERLRLYADRGSRRGIRSPRWWLHSRER